VNLARKYADLIGKEDLNYVISVLPGGISEISRKCKLTRRTVYRLQQEENIKQETKIKLLDACLQTSPSETLRYLVRRSKDKTASITLTFLSSIYESAVSARSSEEFKTCLDNFIEARREHFGLISDEIEDEVSSMLRFLDEKASELAVELPVETFETTRCSQLVEAIPILIRDIYTGRHVAEDLSKTYNVPVEFIRTLADSLITPLIATQTKPDLTSATLLQKEQAPPLPIFHTEIIRETMPIPTASEEP